VVCENGETGDFALSLVGISIFVTLAQTSAPRIVSLKEFSEAYGKNDIQTVSDYFDDDAVWDGPLVDELKGKEAILENYKKFQKNTISMEVIPESHLVDGKKEISVWLIKLRHKKISDGDPVEVRGMSEIWRSEKTGRVIRHRNYFDSGPLLYQSIPVVGWLIRFFIKQQPHDSVPPLLK